MTSHAVQKGEARKRGERREAESETQGERDREAQGSKRRQQWREQDRRTREKGSSYLPCSKNIQARGTAMRHSLAPGPEGIAEAELQSKASLGQHSSALHPFSLCTQCMPGQSRLRVGTQG